MMNWLRERNKSATERRQERMTAYVDGELSPADKTAFEAEMAQDSALSAEAARLQQLKADIGGLPNTRAPRNYTLDPEAFGRPTTPWDVLMLPVLKGATALAALVFIFALVLNFLPSSGGNDMASDTAPSSSAAEVAIVAEATQAPLATATIPAVEEAEEAEAVVLLEEEVEIEEAVIEMETEASDAAMDDMSDAMDTMMAEPLPEAAADYDEAASSGIFEGDGAAASTNNADAAASGAAAPEPVVPVLPEPTRGEVFRADSADEDEAALDTADAETATENEAVATEFPPPPVLDNDGEQQLPASLIVTGLILLCLLIAILVVRRLAARTI